MSCVLTEVLSGFKQQWLDFKGIGRKAVGGVLFLAHILDLDGGLSCDDGTGF